MRDLNNILEKIKGGLIVSCQALEDEPLYSSDIMVRMAKAAKIGGAVGIRANTVADCKAIKKYIDLPLIAILKRVYKDNDVYITPTIREFKEIQEVESDIIAIDATSRKRPDGKTLEEFIKEIRESYKGLLMADISNYEEGIQAERLGFDMVSTTLSGYTDYTSGCDKPDLQLIERLSNDLNIPVIAEGNIQTPEQAIECFKRGATSIVVGAAITRPRLITRKFVDSIQNMK